MNPRYVFFALLILVLACQPVQEFDTAPIQPPEEPVMEDATDTMDNSEQSMSASDRVMELCRMRPDFKATYTVSGTLQEESFSEEQTIIFKGDDYKQAVETDALYVIDDVVYDCRMFEEGWECYQFPPAEEMPDVTADELCQIEEGVTVSEAQGMTVARTQVECFEFSQAEGSETNCYTSTGIPLYSKTETEMGSIERRATAFSTQIAESEFNLPAPPTELSEEDFQMNAQPME